MRRFILARTGQAAIVVVVIATLVFALARMAPGDPFLAFDDPQVTALDRETLRAQWGYDAPLWKQYARWLGNFATGDFGWSHSRSQPVSAVLTDVVPNTFLLMTPAVLIGLLAGVALGTWQAARRDRLAARISDATTLTIASIPDFVVALGVVTLFAATWRLAPMSGMVDPVFHDSMSFAGRIQDVAAHALLPAGTLALLIAASVSRYQRTALLGVLREDYLRTARAKGVPEWRVLTRHALRNALGPVIVIAGLLLPAIFAGTVFIEKVFAWPGMGLTLVNAVSGRDYALVQAVVLIGAVLVALGGAVADVVGALVSPRTRLDA